MRKFNKKGFTIVELVIVIAVIAILAGVLIPTFGGIVEKAQVSAEQQKVTNAYKEAYASELYASNGAIANNATEEAGGYTFQFTTENGKVTGCSITSGHDDSKFDYEYKVATNNWEVKADN